MSRAFVDWLEKLKESQSWTAVRATLRRSLAFAPGVYPPAFPYVEAFVREEGWQREAHYLVAALYALKDGAHQEGRTLAQALKEAERARDSKSVERRFLALLDADRDQIAFRLRQAVGLVEGGLDFAQLLEDLLRWFDPRRRVQARWAREYYGVREEQTQEGIEEVKA
ncbi:type I-E CRISPR-associated protein Cse2/CasB [Thermus tengchongensis]|uniref:Type I-E CRISPR-associated protein Cse2/CasB n=1 Tax=Thermus tengchongensis TaxID=1214928 RepID=A0A4Y9FBK9_9DEIN|nr:type I-E CRISPR-associated protein Cse2/CasB [Thermus tengchongensis]TFU26515.1 type I-E CRISPR-associated protein Cse2/CasB [Thermus tengchongensis]